MVVSMDFKKQSSIFSFHEICNIKKAVLLLLCITRTDFLYGNMNSLFTGVK